MIEFEKRKMERFSLELATYLSIVNKGEKRKSLKFITRNICSGGAFFKTEKPLSIGTDVKLNIILPLDKFKNVKNKRSSIYVSGSVIRTNEKGMAICFDEKCTISPYG